MKLIITVFTYMKKMLLILSAAKLSTRLHNELEMNLKLSISLILYDIFTILSLLTLSIFVICFLIGTEKETHFSVFSPKNSIGSHLNSSASP